MMKPKSPWPLALLFWGAASLAAHAGCSPEQYVEFARKGLGDAEIAKKCADPLPKWLAGDWFVNLKREHFSARERDERQTSNPFFEGLKKFSQLADAPPERRDELWRIFVQDDKLDFIRVYHPKYDPDEGRGFPSFSDGPGRRSGHRLMSSAIKGNELTLEVASPPYGQAGSESWRFTIRLEQGRRSLHGRYEMVRDELQRDGKRYFNSGAVVLFRRR